MKKSTKPARAGRLFGELAAIMARLRGPEGCPWDKRQDHRSLLPYLFSEANEFKLAVRKHDWANMEEELGDILLQVVFHSRLAEEEGAFSLADVVSGINRKLIRRHPHVFGGKKLSTANEVRRQWEEIKRQEKKNAAKSTSPSKKPRKRPGGRRAR